MCSGGVVLLKFVCGPDANRSATRFPISFGELPAGHLLNSFLASGCHGHHSCEEQQPRSDICSSCAYSKLHFGLRHFVLSPPISRNIKYTKLNFRQPRDFFKATMRAALSTVLWDTRRDIVAGLLVEILIKDGLRNHFHAGDTGAE